MRLDVFYNQLLYLFNQNMEGNKITPTLFNMSMESAVLDFCREETGIEVGKKDEKPFWQKDRNTSDAMSPLLVTTGENGVPYTFVSADGYANYPDDFYLYSSIAFPYFSVVNGKTQERLYVVTDLTDEAFNVRLASVRKFPTIQEPISTVRNGKIRVAPKDLKYLRVTYLRLPKIPFYDYDVSGRISIYLPPGTFHNGSNLPAGTPSRSVEVEFFENYHKRILNFAYDFCARNLKDQTAIQLAQNTKIQE